MQTRMVIVGEINYESEKIGRLPDVQFDIKNITALAIDYGIKIHGTFIDIGKIKLLFELRNFCLTAKKDENIVIYYSGHGQYHDGKDYFIPCDVPAEDLGRLTDYLVPMDLGGALKQSKAASITVLVDACRNGFELVTKSGWAFEKFKGGSAQLNIVYSCAPGKYSRFLSKERGSVFTFSFVETLKLKRYEYGTIESIAKEAQVLLELFSEEDGIEKQDIHIESTKATRDPWIKLFPDVLVTSNKENNSDLIESVNAVDLIIILKYFSSALKKSLKNKYTFSIYLALLSSILNATPYVQLLNPVFYLLDVAQEKFTRRLMDYVAMFFSSNGVIFGLALVCLLRLSRSLSYRDFFSIVATSMLAGGVATTLGLYGYNYVHAPNSEGITPLATNLINFWVGPVCSFIGAIVQAAGLACRFGRPKNTAFLLAAPLACGASGFIPVNWTAFPSDWSWFALFLSWQTIFLLITSRWFMNKGPVGGN